MNGNLAQVIGCKQNSGRLHEWDEENRLRFVLGEKFTGYYGYNANGERVYKLTGQSILGQVNSGSIKAQAIFDDAVLYPNPYVVITTKGYTKHYYAGTERIATVIGGGGFGDMVSPTDNLSSPHDQDIIKTFYSYYQNYDPFFYQKIVSQPGKTEDIFGKPSSDLDYQCTPTELVMVDILNPPDILLKSISVNEQNNGPEKEVYFYHGDHLGSANWITDYTGAPVQYIHYAPYGELIDNQAPYLYDERYKFTGKERDQETGYDFFGARYLSSILSHWLSVDPLADKYPCVSPYAYCAWNPIGNIDSDGREFICKLAPKWKINSTTLSESRKQEMIATNNRLATNMYKRDAININNVFELYAHGAPNGVWDQLTFVSNPNKLFNVFDDGSPYLSSKNSNSSIYILYSCYAGNGENSIAQQLSAIKEVSGSVVIAPTGPVSINERGNEYVKDGGIWNVFYKGTKIMEINGEEGSMTRFVQSKLKGEGLKQFLKQCEQKYKNIEQ